MTVDFVKLGAEIGDLVRRKRAAYGDSVGSTGEMLAILFPRGAPPTRYGDAGLVVRILDKLKRLATDPAAFGESPWRDIAGYALCGLALQREKQEQPLPPGAVTPVDDVNDDEEIRRQTAAACEAHNERVRKLARLYCCFAQHSTHTPCERNEGNPCTNCMHLPRWTIEEAVAKLKAREEAGK